MRTAGDLTEGFTPDSVRSSGEPTAIVVRETRPTFTKLPTQQPVLFDHVRDGVPLPAVEPADKHTQHDL